MPVALSELYEARELALGRGLAVLTGWALANLFVSGYYLPRADRRQSAFYFHGMNASWGAINAVLAAWGVLHLHRHAPVGLTLTEALATQFSLEKTFLFNAGLDVAYVVAGLWLVARAAAPDAAKPTRELGFGQSLWVQGGFLLVFDGVMWAAMGQYAAPLLSLVNE